jgi:lysophospholipase L1-like esterase
LKYRRLSSCFLVVLCGLALSDALRAAHAPADSRANPATMPATREAGFMKLHLQYVEQIKQGNIDVIFTGDSITFKWRDTGKAQWEKYYGSMKVANFGHSGDGTQHLLWRLQNGECDGPAPKVVVLMIGTNNMGGNIYSVSDVADGITANVIELRKHWPTTKLFLMGITPSGGSTPPKRKKLDAVNEIISKLDDGRHIFYMDIGPKFMDRDGLVSPALINGLHPTADGYEVWGAAIKEPLDNLLQDKNLNGSPLPPESAH